MALAPHRVQAGGFCGNPLSTGRSDSTPWRQADRIWPIQPRLRITSTTTIFSPDAGATGFAKNAVRWVSYWAMPKSPKGCRRGPTSLVIPILMAKRILLWREKTGKSPRFSRRRPPRRRGGGLPGGLVSPPARESKGQARRLPLSRSHGRISTDAGCSARFARARSRATTQTRRSRL